MGEDNTAVGRDALLDNTEGSSNTAVGGNALGGNLQGVNNAAVGNFTLYNSTGDNNTAVGFGALIGNSSGSGNIGSGAGAGTNVIDVNSVICIGSAGENVANSCYIGHIFGQTASGGSAVFINNNGKLGTSTSSRRFKEQITPMDRASEALFALEPVNFRYKPEIDPAGTAQFGLVAEDVEKVDPDLIVRDAEGKPYSVRYDQVNAMLLNEFLKEHRKVEAQQIQIDALTAQLKQQSARIQKITDELETAKPAAQLAEASH